MLADIIPVPPYPSLEPHIITSIDVPPLLHQKEIINVPTSESIMSPQQPLSHINIPTVAPALEGIPTSSCLYHECRRSAKFENFDVENASLSTVEAFFCHYHINFVTPFLRRNMNKIL